MSTYLIVIGVVAHLALLICFIKPFFKIVNSAIAACSFVRFALAIRKEWGWTEGVWWPLRVPGIWFGHFLDEISSDSISSHGRSGSWHGVGRWQVNKKLKSVDSTLDL